MAHTAMLDTDEDMKWLRDVHLPRLQAKYKSAIIYGNEDAPDRIEVYAARAPVVTDEPLVFEPDDEGVYHQVARKKTPAQLQREIDDVLAKPSHATMQRHHVYRVDKDPRISKGLRGKNVVYLGEKELPAGGGMMARVALLRPDGSAGDEYLVREHHLSKV